MELVGLSPSSSRPAAVWDHAQRVFSLGCVPKRNDEGMTTHYTALGVSGADEAVAASVREDASWANRNFPAWAKQSISFAVCATKALAIDRILRNDSLASLTQRGKCAPHRPPGVVGYCPTRHTQAKERSYREDRRYD